MGLYPWFEQYWFTLVQTIGIVTGFYVAARALTLDSRARQAEVHLALTQAHREIWANLIQNPELSLVLDADRDVLVSPPTSSEERFVLLVLLHTASIYRAISLKILSSWPGLEKDISGFFSLPLPFLVLGKYRTSQNDDFLRYMDSLIPAPPVQETPSPLPRRTP